jgi:hypothetical protein
MSVLQHTSGITDGNLTGGDIFGDDGPSSNDGAISNRNSFQYYCAGTHEYAAANPNGLGYFAKNGGILAPAPFSGWNVEVGIHHHCA